jgi:alpha-1,3-rhamnosyltransferase
MEQDNNMVFVATTRNYVLEHNKNGNLVRKEDTKILQGIRTAQHILDYEYKHLDSFYIQGALFRKEIIDAVKGFDEDMTGDDIVLRIKIARYVKDNPHLRFTMLDNFGFCYRKHGDNIHKNTFRQVKIVAEVMERYYPEMPLSNEVCNWIKCCFEHLPFNKAMECFFINSKTKSLLQDVNNPMLDFVFLRYKLEKKKQTFLYRLTHKYLYNKEKNYSTGVRTVMILYFLKFSYRK